jgi:hypothetical protein
MYYIGGYMNKSNVIDMNSRRKRPLTLNTKHIEGESLFMTQRIGELVQELNEISDSKTKITSDEVEAMLCQKRGWTVEEKTYYVCKPPQRCI